MRGVRANGSSRILLRVSVRSNVCEFADQGHTSRFGTPRRNCVRSWTVGKRLTERRIFILGYESFWNCSAMAPRLCNPNPCWRVHVSDCKQHASDLPIVPDSALRPDLNRLEQILDSMFLRISSGFVPMGPACHATALVDGRMSHQRR